MIAEDFGPVRVLATESIAGPTVEGACARTARVYTGPKDPRGHGQRSLQPAHRHDRWHRGQLLETMSSFDAETRPGEKCGLAPRISDPTSTKRPLPVDDDSHVLPSLEPHNDRIGLTRYKRPLATCPPTLLRTIRTRNAVPGMHHAALRTRRQCRQVASQ